MGQGCLKAQTSSHKIHKFWECHVQNGDYNYQYCILYLKVAKGADSKNSHHKKKKCLTT